MCSFFVYSTATNRKVAQYCKHQLTAHCKVTVICLSIVCYTCMSAWQEMPSPILQCQQMQFPCQQGTLHVISMPRYATWCHKANGRPSMPAPCRPDALSAISIPKRYSACHLHASKVQCMPSQCQQETLPSPCCSVCHSQAYRNPCMPFPCQQETLQAIFFVLTRYPACRLHADKMPCMLFQCQQVYLFQ